MSHYKAISKNRPYFYYFDKMKREIFVLFAVFLGFILLNTHDLTNWYYSFIGDEYAFFEKAKEIAQGE